MPKLSALGEFGVIARLQKILPKPNAKNWPVAIGDDAAVRRLPGGYELAAQDMLLEGVHFLRGDLTHWESVGWKALAVNLSDLAAMGGKPVGATVALGIPKGARTAEVEALYRGLARCAKKFSCPVVGGDTNASRGGWAISVAMLGAMKKAPLLRSAARPGDGLWVTGELGGAALGWRAIQKRVRGSTLAPFRRRHALPMPRLAWGECLAGSGRVNACIDLSDGLAGDLEHLAVASGVGFEVEVPAVPRPRRFPELCRQLGVAPLDLLLGGGEDYELLFTVRREQDSSFRDFCRRHRVIATRIGTATKQKGIEWRGAGTASRRVRGFRHF